MAATNVRMFFLRMFVFIRECVAKGIGFVEKKIKLFSL